MKCFFFLFLFFFHYVKEFFVFILLPVLVRLSNLSVRFILVTTQLRVFKALLQWITATAALHHHISVRWFFLLIRMFGQLRTRLAFRLRAVFFKHGTFFLFLFVHEFIVDTVIQVCVIVLLIDPILLSTLPCKLDYSSWHNHINYFIRPFKRFLLVFLWRLFLRVVNEHWFDWVEGRQDVWFLFSVLLLGFFILCILSLQVMFSKQGLLSFLDLRERCMSAWLPIVFIISWLL